MNMEDSRIHSGIQIRLLGDLQLTSTDGRARKLPASKKTRALIGYLIATGRPHRRERLCDLLWDGPNDPRAELRWSLNKARAVLNDPGVIRLTADRESVAFQPHAADIDLTRVRQLLQDGVATASIEALQTAIGLFRGEFLDGLDLLASYRYQEWCAAEREAISRVRLAVLGSLIDRLDDSPDDALPYARALVAADPLSEAGHAAVVRLLGRLGRKKEALGHYDLARRVIEAELGAPPSEELEQARVALRSASPRHEPAHCSSHAATAATGYIKSAQSADLQVPFVGRQAERSLVDRLVAASVDARARNVLVVTGEPGIGKSLLLEHLRERMASSGGRALSGRAFEAEMTRPYGIWIDILRPVSLDRGVGRLWQDLASLVPVGGPPASDPADRSRLFDGVLNLLKHLAAEQPIAITLDDLHWVDDASASLIHYVIRTFDGPCGLLVACGARSGEVDDNPAAAGVLRSLGREGRLHEVVLAPLRAEETAELVRAAAPQVDIARVVAESEGNPLFALGLARTPGQGQGGPGWTLDLVISGQLASLKDRARDLLMWAAALGRSFTVDVLARAAGFDTSELLGVLEDLERRRIVQPVGEHTYDFVHDLVRQASYRSISQPRRTLIHRQIARLLTVVAETDPAAAADLARHAGLCGDHEIAAGACAVAGQRALCLFANAEAAGFAARGLRHVDQLLPGPRRLETYIRLTNIRILAAAGPGMRRLPPLREEISTAVAAAEALGLHAVAATGHQLLSILDQESGDLHRAHESSLRAAQVVRGMDPATSAQQLANTARCLLELEADVVQSRALIREAEILAEPLGLELCELHWARGLIHRWGGEYDAAVPLLERALAMARDVEDRWREYKCLTWLAVFDLERGHAAATTDRCAELMQVATKLGEAHVPFVATLEVLARMSAGERGAETRLGCALDELRAVDDKSYLAYALNEAAVLHLRNGRICEAVDSASEALKVAETMQRYNEIVMARATLACAGVNDDRSSAVEQLEALQRECAGQDRISTRARAVLSMWPRRSA
jgi:DNA-binding SARP family transcriptional activator/tetratricopeptide (TPR) repeat protein